MVTAPHHLAAQSGLAVLRDGGNAIEATIAAASVIAVVYPHMNSIGGDGFWLIAPPEAPPIGIEGCGAAGGNVTPELYRRHGLAEIPNRGGLAANTPAGTLSGWNAALEMSAKYGGKLPLERLFRDAIHYAEEGFAVTRGQAELTAAKLDELREVPGFRDSFLVAGRPPERGTIFRQPRLGATFRQLMRDGIDSFYRGTLARSIAADLARAGSPLTLADLAAQRARLVSPLALELSCGTVFNMPPPTQGLASLLILGLFERLDVREADGFAYVHGLVEATKQAFLVRDRVAVDPAAGAGDPKEFLTAAALSQRAALIDRRRAAPWPGGGPPSDTIWIGAIDADGLAVSFIQSTYWEFGAGVVLAESGIVWQNRGSSFRLSPDRPNALVPARRPFHTLNPAFARLHDGRRLVYGTMGGDGQPQTQAAVFTRHVLFGQGLQEATSAPRWLLGRTWGAASTSLKLEAGFEPGLAAALAAAGHNVEAVPRFDSVFGHAGAVLRHAGGVFEGASDPRSDGCAAGW